MGTLRGLVLAGAAATVIMPFLAGTGPVKAADITEPEPIGYTYLNLEGGYVNLDGQDVQAYLHSPGGTLSERSLDLTDGYYGRVELGHVWDTDMLLNGIGAYVQGWDGDKEDVSDTDINVGLATQHDGLSGATALGCSIDGQGCAHAEADLDRSLIEVGLRFFHTYGDAQDLDGLSLGVEPFVAFIDEETNSSIGTLSEPDIAQRSSDMDATAYGALLALDGRHHILERTVLTGRVAAGAYYMDAEADTSFDVPPGFSLNDDVSSDFVGFRGQLAVGLEQLLTDTLSIGVIGRLDYWSDYPSMQWTDLLTTPNSSDNKIASDDFLALSIGARISVVFQ
jgi:hypothetical protein